MQQWRIRSSYDEYAAVTTNMQQLLWIRSSFYEYAAVTTVEWRTRTSKKSLQRHTAAIDDDGQRTFSVDSSLQGISSNSHTISSTVKLSKIGADFWQFHNCKYGRSPHESDPDCVNYMSRTRYVRDRYIIYFYCKRTKMLTVIGGFRPYGFHTVSLDMCPQSKCQDKASYGSSPPCSHVITPVIAHVSECHVSVMHKQSYLYDMYVTKTLQSLCWHVHTTVTVWSTVTVWKPTQSGLPHSCVHMSLLCAHVSVDMCPQVDIVCTCLCWHVSVVCTCLCWHVPT